MSIECVHLNKSIGNPPRQILDDINLLINDGEFVSITGKSGSGKSTLLYILSTLDNPTSGKMLIDGVFPLEMTSKDLHRYRAEKIGFIFQFHYLLAELTALENVLLPAKNLNLDAKKKDEALELLNRFGIYKQKDKLPGQMSGGEQQRVAIARALIMGPKYVFADEPTGSLDSANGQIVMDILSQVNKNNKTTVVLVTHEPDYAKIAQREIVLVDGKIYS